MNNNVQSETRQSLHGNWSSRLALILAVTGSAVSGKTWKFPYMAGQMVAGHSLLFI